MNKLTNYIELRNSELAMSSREIAKLTNKEHRNVLADIRNMLDELKIQSADFSADYKDSRGRTYQEYLLPKKYIECLLTGYSIPLRMKVIDRMHELEKRFIPQTLPEALRAYADECEKNLKLESKIQEDAPKVEFMNNFIDITTTKSLRETAKILKMPERAMIDLLIDNHILFRQSGNLLPYADQINKGYFEVKAGEKHGHAYTQTRVTTKGLSYIAGRFASELMVA